MSFWIKALMHSNVFFYRLTQGWIGGAMGGQSVLLLTTTGRKSGKTYTTPTNYYNVDGSYVLVASNWGQERNPAWYLNLMHQPEASIQVKGQKLRVRARQASAEEYPRLWQYVTAKNPFYVRYQQQTKRKIPIVMLAPV